MKRYRLLFLSILIMVIFAPRAPGQYIDAAPAEDDDITSPAAHLEDEETYSSATAILDEYPGYEEYNAERWQDNYTGSSGGYKTKLLPFVMMALFILALYFYSLVSSMARSTDTLRMFVTGFLIISFFSQLLGALTYAALGILDYLNVTSNHDAFRNAGLFLLGATITLVFGRILMGGFYAFAIPSTKISAIPIVTILFLHGYIFSLSSVPFALGGATYIFILVGLFFPTHRRMLQLWRPTPLPNIRRPAKSKQGTTLIELLIFISILSIFSLLLARVVSVQSMAAERQQARREALALAEDQIALLRAHDQLPEIGLHPLAPELLERDPNLAPGASMEIRPGPAPGLRQARVLVPWDPATSETLTLAVILSAKETTP